MIEVREIFAHTKPGCSSVAAHCVPPAGYVLTSQGFRVYQNGTALFSSQRPFPNRAEAQARADAL